MNKTVAIIGAGPAGLMAADWLSAAGVAVTVHDRMPSPGRKFLLAGRGGLNLTHSEALDHFVTRYGGSVAVKECVRAFSPDDLRNFAHLLGQETFVGTSGRVFPKSFKASPLLRAWLVRLRERGVGFAMRHTFVGFEDGRPVLLDGAGTRIAPAVDATVLALGGGSWPKLGSDGAWVTPLRDAGVGVATLRPANCGLRIGWSAAMHTFAGMPIKPAAFSFEGERQRGEAVVTRVGLEGGAIYGLSRAIRARLDSNEAAYLTIDLVPHLSEAAVASTLSQDRTKESWANTLRKRLSLTPVARAVLRESEGGPLPADAAGLATRVKRARFHVTGVADIDRAISTSGGVLTEAMDEHAMLKALPGVFVAGEMLDWDAPTGGYLLQACFATGRAAALGVLGWLAR